MVVRITASVINQSTIPVLFIARGYVESPAGNRIWSDYSNTITLNPNQSTKLVIDVPFTPSTQGTYKAGIQLMDPTTKELYAEGYKTFDIKVQLSITIENVEIIP